MLRTKDIETAAIAASRDADVCFVITKQNKWTLFAFCYYQLKHRTIKEFNCIIYNKEKDILYYILKFVVLLNSKKYKLLYEPSREF